jgi:hypothetical protein
MNLSIGAITVVEPGSDPDRTKGVVKMSKKFNSGEVPKETFFSGLKLLHKGRSIAPRELRRQKASLEVKKLQQDILDKQKAQQQRQRLKETTQSFLTGQQGVPGQPATGELEAQLRGVPLGGQTAQVQLPELAGELAEAGQLGQLKQFAPEAPETATDIEKRRVAVQEKEIDVRLKELEQRGTSSQQKTQRNFNRAFKNIIQTHGKLLDLLPEETADEITRNALGSLMDTEGVDVKSIQKAFEKEPEEEEAKGGIFDSIKRFLGLGDKEPKEVSREDAQAAIDQAKRELPNATPAEQNKRAKEIVGITE